MDRAQPSQAEQRCATKLKGRKITSVRVTAYLPPERENRLARWFGPRWPANASKSAVWYSNIESARIDKCWAVSSDKNWRKNSRIRNNARQHVFYRPLLSPAFLCIFLVYIFNIPRWRRQILMIFSTLEISVADKMERSCDV